MSRLSQTLRTGTLPTGLALAPTPHASQQLARFIVQGAEDAFEALEENGSILLEAVDEIRHDPMYAPFESPQAEQFADILFYTVGHLNYTMQASQYNPDPILNIWTSRHFSEAALKAIITTAMMNNTLSVQGEHYDFFKLTWEATYQAFQEAKAFYDLSPSERTTAGQNITERQANTFAAREPNVVFSSISDRRPGKTTYTLPQEEDSVSERTSQFDEINELQDAAERQFQQKADRIHKMNQSRSLVGVSKDDLAPPQEKQRYTVEIADVFAENTELQVDEPVVEDDPMGALGNDYGPVVEEDEEINPLETITASPVGVSKNEKQEKPMAMYGQQPHDVYIYDCIFNRDICHPNGDPVIVDERDAPQVPVTHAVDDRDQPMYRGQIPVILFSVGKDNYGNEVWEEWSPQAEADFLRASRAPARPQSAGRYGPGSAQSPAQRGGAQTPAALSRAYTGGSQPQQPAAGYARTQSPALNRAPASAPVPEPEVIYRDKEDSRPKVEMHDGSVYPFYLASKTNVQASGWMHFQLPLPSSLDDMTVIVAMDEEEGKVFEILVEKEKVDRENHIPAEIVRLTPREGTKADLAKIEERPQANARTVTVGAEALATSINDATQILHHAFVANTPSIHDVIYTITPRGKCPDESLITDVMETMETEGNVDGMPAPLCAALRLLDKTETNNPGIFLYFNRMLTTWINAVIRFRVSEPNPSASSSSFKEDVKAIMEYLKGKGCLTEVVKMMKEDFPRLINLSVEYLGADVVDGNEEQDDGEDRSPGSPMLVNTFTVPSILVEEDELLDVGRLNFASHRYLYNTLNGAFQALDNAGKSPQCIFVYTHAGQVLTVTRVGKDFPKFYITDVH